MMCGECGAFLGVIRFPDDGGGRVCIARCPFCHWRSTWLEDLKHAKAAPLPRRARQLPEASNDSPANSTKGALL